MKSGFYLFALLTLTVSFVAYAEDPHTTTSHSTTWAKPEEATPMRLPYEFQIHQKIISWIPSYTMRINDKTPDFGAIDEKVFSWGKTFDIKDKNGTIIGTAKERVFAWGATVDVYDENGALLGTIKEDLLKSFLGMGYQTQYTITDASGKFIGQSEKLDAGSTAFFLSDAKGNVFLEMKRPWIRFLADDWNVRVADPKAMDPRLFLTIAAFKSEADKKSSHDDDDDDDDK